MKKILYSALLSIAAMGWMQSASAQCDGQRYYSKIFSQVDTTTVIYTDPAVTSQNIDIYQPHGDNATNRRAILIIHGGSFYGGTRQDDFIAYMCREFAMRGYVTASIDYRLVPVQNIASLTDSNSAYPYVIKSIADGKAAMRFLKKNAATYGIDSGWIAIGGESAGAIIANHIVYVTSISEATPLLASAFNSVGGFDGNSGNPGYSTNSKAVLNLAGALLFTGFLDATDHTPVYSAQGDADQTVPYQCGHVLGGASDITMCGAGAMKPVLDNLGITNQLHTFPGDPHVPWETDTTKRNIVENESALFLYKVECPTFTAINEVSNVKVGLYPNPASSQITIAADANMESINVVDNLGRTVSTTTVSGTQGTVDVSGLAAGIYVAKINLKTGGSTARTFSVK
ncbi:MAG: carboxylesterase family protein [Bacteroidetes bacterium]|nr:carboxylesterase family protein [Bacteroidota bacterium]